MEIEKELALRQCPGTCRQLMPFFAMADPDFFDRLHGSRGSAVIMAQRMAEGARFAMDPTSGMLGMGKENFKWNTATSIR